MFEMGAALIGSVATLIFSEYQNKRQLNENMEFRSNLLQRIEQPPDETLAHESSCGRTDPTLNKNLNNLLLDLGPPS